MKDIAALRDVLSSGGVTRFHAEPGIPAQSLASHQWRVALMVQFMDPDCSKELILAAMTHDAAEAHTGDVHFSIKLQAPKLKAMLDMLEQEWELDRGICHDLDAEEEILLKVADILEGMWYCTEQVHQGSNHALVVFKRWDDLLKSREPLARVINTNVRSNSIYRSLVKTMDEIK